jgi:hypothetical protein
MALWFAATHAAAIAFAVAAVAIFAVVRPFSRAVAAFGGALRDRARVVEHADATQRPQLATDVARTPSAELNGDILTIHDVRDFRYRSETDYDENWETRTYDLSKLERLDFFMSYWGSPNIAHTIMSWAFSDGQHLAISIETRKEVGEEYSSLAGSSASTSSTTWSPTSAT